MKRKQNVQIPDRKCKALFNAFQTNPATVREGTLKIFRNSSNNIFENFHTASVGFDIKYLVIKKCDSTCLMVIVKINKIKNFTNVLHTMRTSFE